MYILANLVNDLYKQLINMPDDALAVSKMPASGSFINVGDYEMFGFEIVFGALDTSCIFQVEQDTGATQTADIKDVTGATVTVAGTGDDKFYQIEVQIDEMDSNNDFDYVTLDITGAAGSNDMASIMFYAVPKRKPVTTHASHGNSVILAGGQATAIT